MIRTRLYRNGVCHDENFDPKRISDHLDAHDGSVVWLDLEEPSPEHMALIADEFNLNPLAVEDATTERQRPKLDHYADHLFISMYDVTVVPDSHHLTLHELAIFVAHDYLITVRKTPGYSMDDVVKRWDDNHDLAKNGVGFLLWGLLDVLVDRHFDTVQSLDDDLEAVEDLLFDSSDPGNEVQRKSYTLRKDLVGLRRVVMPTREVVNALMRRESNIVSDEMIPYYQDIYDHVLRAADNVDSLRDLVSSILETSLTMQGNRMNEIMKALTSYAAIAAVPTVIAGYYGMNVRIFPGANTTTGGIVALALIAAGCAFLYVLFKKRDWL